MKQVKVKLGAFLLPLLLAACVTKHQPVPKPLPFNPPAVLMQTPPDLEPIRPAQVKPK